MSFKYRTDPDLRAAAQAFLAWLKRENKHDVSALEDALVDLNTALAECSSLMAQVATLEDELATMRAAQTTLVADLGVWPSLRAAVQE